MRKFDRVFESNDRREEERFIKELFEDPKTFSQTVIFILNNATSTTTAKRQREEALTVFSCAARCLPDAMHHCMKEPGFECDKLTERIVHVLLGADDVCIRLCLILLNSPIAHVLVRDRVSSVVDALVKLLNVSNGWSTTNTSSSSSSSS